MTLCLLRITTSDENPGGALNLPGFLYLWLSAQTPESSSRGYSHRPLKNQEPNLTGNHVPVKASAMSTVIPDDLHGYLIRREENAKQFVAERLSDKVS